MDTYCTQNSRQGCNSKSRALVPPLVKYWGQRCPKDTRILPEPGELSEDALRVPECWPRVRWIFTRGVREFLRVPEGCQNVATGMKECSLSDSWFVWGWPRGARELPKCCPRASKGLPDVSVWLLFINWMCCPGQHVHLERGPCQLQHGDQTYYNHPPQITKRISPLF